MDAKEFDAALARALGVCRAAADLELPVEAMLEHVEAEAEAALNADDRQRYTQNTALCEIIATVGEVATIGAELPLEVPSRSPQPSQTIPSEPDFPMPANLRG